MAVLEIFSEGLELRIGDLNQAPNNLDRFYKTERERKQILGREKQMGASGEQKARRKIKDFTFRFFKTQS